jgi:hypothetical protein
MAYKVTYPLMWTEQEARDVLIRMQGRIDEHGYVTVKNMYDMVLMLDTYRGRMDHAYGWLDLKMAVIEYNPREGCYEVLLPVPVALR